MAQNASKWHQQCRKCDAGVGRPCRDLSGKVAEKVHYGRGEYTPKYRKRGAKLRRATPQERPAFIPAHATVLYIEAYDEVESRRLKD